MSEEVLSHEEIDELLSMIVEGKYPTTKYKTITRDEDAPFTMVGKEQMRSLQIMHEAIGKRLAASIEKILCVPVEVCLRYVDQMYYSEFVFGCDNPTWFNLLQVKIPNVRYSAHDAANVNIGYVLIDVSPTVCFTVVDRMAGGIGETSRAYRRPMTRIEQRLIQRVLDGFIAELIEAWNTVTELEFDVVRQESNPQQIQEIKPNCPVVIFCFEVASTDGRGTITFCMPVDVLEQLTGRTNTTNTNTNDNKQEPN